jgi:exopolysaccharide biosynthesis WecB/TagA/CpsF family protein
MRQSTHCRIVETFSGYLAEAQYRKIFSEHREVDFIFLGMGTPKTEQVAAWAAAIAPRAIVWGIGGGTIRIYAGTLKEAPAFLRRLGLQWVYRLIEEPAKLWKRYLIGNPVFFLRILREVIFSSRKQPSGASRP